MNLNRSLPAVIFIQRLPSVSQSYYPTLLIYRRHSHPHRGFPKLRLALHVFHRYPYTRGIIRFIRIPGFTQSFFLLSNKLAVLLHSRYLLLEKRLLSFQTFFLLGRELWIFQQLVGFVEHFLHRINHLPGKRGTTFHDKCTRQSTRQAAASERYVTKFSVRFALVFCCKFLALVLPFDCGETSSISKMTTPTKAIFPFHMQ